MPTASPTLPRDEAVRAARDAAQRLGAPWGDVVVDDVATRRCDVGWIVIAHPPPHEPDEAQRNIQAALFPGSPERVMSVFFVVTDAGVVYGTGTAFPIDVYVEDVRVLGRYTWNPLRLARYLARRVFDGRTAFRLAP